MTEAVNVGGPGEIHTKLPSDLQQVRTVIKYDILKHLRSRRLLGMLVIEALLIVLIAWLVMGEPAQPFVTTMSAFTGLAPTLIIIGATLFAGDAIVSEFQGRTGYLLPQPGKAELAVQSSSPAAPPLCRLDLLRHSHRPQRRDI